MRALFGRDCPAQNWPREQVRGKCRQAGYPATSELTESLDHLTLWKWRDLCHVVLKQASHTVPCSLFCQNSGWRGVARTVASLIIIP